MSGPRVATTAGTVEGTEAGGVRRWWGIPFAAPPVGERRWCRPEPPEPWPGVRPATAFGPDCPQTPSGSGTTRAPGQSEDCLHLNVWAPAGAEGAPVLVWFYGGSFLFGSGSDPRCDGTTFARRGVVLVTANYRVGLFGYLAHPELRAAPEAGGPASSGNYGLADIMAALRWVRANIAGFGGDPANVTAFGVSAGSASLSLLLTAPEAAGCFDRVILESPGSFRPLATLDEAEAAAVEAFGPSIGPWRALPAAELLAETGRLAPKVRRLLAPRVLRPIADGVLVPHDERHAYESGAVHRVPVLVGGNLDEGTTLTAGWPVTTVAAWRDLLALEFGPDAPAAAELWPAASDAEVPRRVAELFGDTQFSLGARGIARCVAATGTPVWRYLYTHRPAGADGGPNHGDEVPYVFDSVADPTPADRAVTARFQEAWVRFATTGDPSGPGLAWPPVGAADPAAEPYLVISPEPALGHGHRRAQLDFLDHLARPR